MPSNPGRSNIFKRRLNDRKYLGSPFLGSRVHGSGPFTQQGLSFLWTWQLYPSAGLPLCSTRAEDVPCLTSVLCALLYILSRTMLFYGMTSEKGSHANLLHWQPNLHICLSFSSWSTWGKQRLHETHPRLDPCKLNMCDEKTQLNQIFRFAP